MVAVEIRLTNELFIMIHNKGKSFWKCITGSKVDNVRITIYVKANSQIDITL